MADGTVKLRGEAAEVALGEAQAVLSMVADPERRGRLGDLIAAIGDREVEGADAQALEELLELGLQARAAGPARPPARAAALRRRVSHYPRRPPAAWISSRLPNGSRTKNRS